MAQIEMVVDTIRISLKDNSKRVVILKEKSSIRYLPIWVGSSEADAIAIKIHDVSVPVPLIHDVLCNIVNVTGLMIKSAIISKVVDGVFYAKLVVAGDNIYEVDCKPSDSIAIAIRVGAPIFVEDHVLNNAGILYSQDSPPK